MQTTLEFQAFVTSYRENKLVVHKSNKFFLTTVGKSGVSFAPLKEPICKTSKKRVRKCGCIALAFLIFKL